jgi:hypothetical protein
MPGELNEGDIFFAHRIKNSDGAQALTGEPHDGAARATKLALQRMHVFCRKVVVLLKEPL